MEAAQRTTSGLIGKQHSFNPSNFLSCEISISTQNPQPPKVPHPNLLYHDYAMAENSTTNSTPVTTPGEVADAPLEFEGREQHADSLRDREERAVAALLTRFKNLVTLAAMPVEEGATKELAASQAFQMEVESSALVSLYYLRGILWFGSMRPFAIEGRRLTAMQSRSAQQKIFSN
jgi:hypothetical protein